MNHEKIIIFRLSVTREIQTFHKNIVYDTTLTLIYPQHRYKSAMFINLFIRTIPDEKALVKLVRSLPLEK
jgi:hypothetical protein